MAQKLFVNNTGSQVTGALLVRLGSSPGQILNTVQLSLPPGQQMVPYGNDSNPYMDQLEISVIQNGGITLSDQIVLTRGSELDNEFNMNDTITIGIQNNSLVVTTSNTWT